MIRGALDRTMSPGAASSKLFKSATSLRRIWGGRAKTIVPISTVSRSNPLESSRLNNLVTDHRQS